MFTPFREIEQFQKLPGSHAPNLMTQEFLPSGRGHALRSRLARARRSRRRPAPRRRSIITSGNAAKAPSRCQPRPHTPASPRVVPPISTIVLSRARALSLSHIRAHTPHVAPISTPSRRRAAACSLSSLSWVCRRLSSAFALPPCHCHAAHHGCLTFLLLLSWWALPPPLGLLLLLSWWAPAPRGRRSR